MDDKKEKKLKINSTLADLDLYDVSIDEKRQVAEALGILRKNTMIPGIVIFSETKYKGMISRSRLFECMSRHYSYELYMYKPIEFLLEDNPFFYALEFSSETLIPDATMRALNRKGDLLFEPVVVRFYDGHAEMLDMHKLLLAQVEIHLLYVESLKEANEFKSEILSIAAHDLKNRLNSIMGISSLIKEDTKELPMINQMAETVFKSSQHMHELIIQLLDSSVVEVGKVELNKIPLDICNLTSGIVSNNYQLAAKKEQKLLFGGGFNDEVLVLADKVRLTEAIENLVSNAIKYSPKGKNITVNLKTSADKIQVRVTDEGPGIKEEEKNKLFRKFQRLSARPTGGESSTGLGLYIVRQIVELHDGRIWVESEYLKGSSFIIELPVSRISGKSHYDLN